jgi:hypothetical protein
VEENRRLCQGQAAVFSASGKSPPASMPLDKAILEAKKNFYFFLAKTIDFNYLIAYNINIKRSAVTYDLRCVLPQSY